MIILPAIDILDQQPVRLYQGDYEQKECVGDSIGDIAKAFEQQGARGILQGGTGCADPTGHS